MAYTSYEDTEEEQQRRVAAGGTAELTPEQRAEMQAKQKRRAAASALFDAYLARYRISQNEAKLAELDQREQQAILNGNRRMAEAGGDPDKQAAARQETETELAQIAQEREALRAENVGLEKKAGIKRKGEGSSGTAEAAAGAARDVNGTIADTLARASYNAMSKSGVDPSGVSASDRRNAELQEQNAQQLDKAAQANNQIANRDYLAEAEREAFAKSATLNKQTVNNLKNASAGAAALERETAEGDYNAMRARQDEQRQRGVENMNKANAQRQGAEASRATGKQRDYRASDMDATNWAMMNATYPSQGGESGRKNTPQLQGRRPPVTTQEETVTEGGQPPPFKPQNVINYLCDWDFRRTLDTDEIVRGPVAAAALRPPQQPSPNYEAVASAEDSKIPQIAQWFVQNVYHANGGDTGGMSDEELVQLITTPITPQQKQAAGMSAPTEENVLRGWATGIYGSQGEPQATFLNWLTGKQGRGANEGSDESKRNTKVWDQKTITEATMPPGR